MKKMLSRKKKLDPLHTKRQNKNKINQLHTVYRTLQGRQRAPSVKTLRSPLSVEFWRNCVLSGRTQRRKNIKIKVKLLDCSPLYVWIWKQNYECYTSFVFSITSLKLNGCICCIYLVGHKGRVFKSYALHTKNSLRKIKRRTENSNFCGQIS